MSDFVTRAKEVNQKIGRANKNTSQARTRKQVLEENFIKNLAEFSKAEGTDFVAVYNEKGIDAIKSVLSRVKQEAEQVLAKDVELAERCISAYEARDYSGLNSLLGNVPEIANAVAPVVEAPAVNEPVVEAPVEEALVQNEPAPTADEEDLVDPWGNKIEVEKVANVPTSSLSGFFNAPVEKEETEEDPVTSGSSIFDSIAEEGEEEASSVVEQTTQPSMGLFTSPAVVKETPKKLSGGLSGFFEDDDEVSSEPKSAAVKPRSASSSLFLDDGEEESDSNQMSDISLTDLMAGGNNINHGGQSF